jgi:hypothetical protein
MVDVNTAPAPLGENIGGEGNLASTKRQWIAPRLARLNGRSAMSGFPGNTSDHTVHTSAILS